MNRREILRYTALVTGAAVAGPLVSSLLSGCRPETTAGAPEGALSFFSPEEFERVRELADLILPKTDSPSASDVGVHTMIDQMLGKVYPEKDREAYKTGFSALTAYLDSAGFSKLDPGQKLELLKNLELSREEAMKTTRKAFVDLKQQTVAYYLSTEAVGTQFLNYLPVPGKYESCISLEEAGGKAWAL